jgi:uncharacterized protein (DUF2252 family)
MTAVLVPPKEASRRRTVARHRTASQHPYQSPQDRAAAGKAVRKTVRLADHAAVAPSAERPDPVALLEEQAADRLPDLAPVRYGRMSVSAFTFYRGAARIMASDLARVPHTDLTVQLCGDAHLSNFGMFGSPERRLVFDINDFDETLPGPFEWDVKRLTASLVIASRDRGFPRKQEREIALSAAASYRAAMAEFAGMRDIDVWYNHLDTADLAVQLKSQLDAKRMKRLNRSLGQARARDSVQALKKLTTMVDGTRRIVSNPPLIVPLRDILPPAEDAEIEERFHDLIRQYRRTLQPDRRILLERYHFVDMARKVVGVGSVGTRCWIVLLTGRDPDDPLFLQVKEAGKSVLAEFLGRSEYPNQGQRVVHGQRLMQQSSDLFLGWQRTTGIDGVERDFYVRQLRDWKGSIDVETLLPEGLSLYGQICAWTLARAHARSGDRIAIAGYLGSSPTFDQAIGEFAASYADLNEQDYQSLTDSIQAGTVVAQAGL